jgi:hypothetical protein
MSATSMTITTFKRTAVSLPPSESVLLRANHGVGKSQVVRQVSAIIRKDIQKENPKWTFPVIDRRAGQLTEGDVVGLPSTDGEVTRFNPPDWYKQACKEPCVLFLDELNRGTTEVMQAMFQIVLDRELNGWKLHPLTRVYSAINTNAIYTVNEVDPALLDRFWVIDLEPTVEEWLAWAKNEDKEQGGGLHYFVVDFIQGHNQWLSPAKNANPGDKQPSARSWQKLDRAMKHAGIMDDPGSEMFYQLSRGFVGNECAIAFRDFCKTIDNQLSGEDLLERFTTKPVQAKVNRQTQERLNGLIDKLSEHVVKTCTKLTDAQGKNVQAFMKHLPQELRISLWSKLTVSGIDKIELAKSIHKWCAESVLDVFGVPMGEAGIGVVPNVPGIFKQQNKDAK